eukprot:4927997-Prymnesium_polylepis.1
MHLDVGCLKAESGTFRDIGTAGVWSFQRSYRTGDTRSVMDPSHLTSESVPLKYAHRHLQVLTIISGSLKTINFLRRATLIPHSLAWPSWAVRGRHGRGRAGLTPVCVWRGCVTLTDLTVSRTAGLRAG